MPKRSNDFQRLVYLLQKTTAPLNATVTESELEPDTSTGEPREIDVCLKCADGDVRILIAVEVKYEKRRMSIERFDGFLGKYFVEGGVDIDKLIIVNAAGFVRRTIARARTVNKSGKYPPVELMTMTDALNPAAWGKCFPDSTVLKMSLPTEMRLTNTRPRLTGHSMAGLVKSKSTLTMPTKEQSVTLEHFIARHLYPNLLRSQAEKIGVLRKRAEVNRRTEETPFECKIVPPAILTHNGRNYLIHGFEGLIRQPTNVHSMTFTRKDVLDVLNGGSRRFAVADVNSDSVGMRMAFPDGPDSEKISIEIQKLPFVFVTCSTSKMLPGN